MLKIVSLFLAMTLVAFASPAGAQQAATTIRVATNPIESGAEVFYAKEMGFFAKAGLDVQLQPGNSGAAIAAAVASNAVDFGYSDMLALAKAHTKGIPFVAVFPAAEWTPSSRLGAIVVENGSAIRGAKELAGKVLAVPGLGTLAEYGPRAWIDKNGGSAASVRFIEMPYSAMPDALKAGRIDAAYVSEPYLTIARENARILGYAFDAIAKSFTQTAWFTSASYAKAHPDLVNRFVTVIHETARWANQPENREKTAEILVKYTRADPALVARMQRAHYGEQLSAAEIQPPIDATSKYAGFASFSADELIYHAP